MSNAFYNRSLFRAMQIPPPQCYVDLATFLDKTSKGSFSPNFYFDNAENICRRHADIKFYSESIESEYYGRPDPFDAATAIQTYLVGYFSSVKAFVDGIAICLNQILNFELKLNEQDLTRRIIWEKLEAKNQLQYHSNREFFQELKVWRNTSLHQLQPYVIVHAKNSVIQGRSPLEIKRDEVDIRMANFPGLSSVEFSKKVKEIEWVSPLHYVEAWNNNIIKLAEIVCVVISQRIMPVSSFENL